MNVKTRLVAVVAGLAAASVALTGCLFEFRPAPGSTASAGSAPDTSGVDASLMPFYAQQLTWSACSTGFDCATVTAPADWDHPSAGKVNLALIRHKATGGTRDGSLLVNPGGPGASGVSLVRDSLQFAVGDTLAADFDVIGFDPRGVGASTAVTCYDAKQMDAFLFDIPAAPRGSAAWRTELMDSAAQFGQACQRNSTIPLTDVSTVFAARDMDLIRAVLGEKKLDYLGYSYGTFLGATYAKLYPHRVGRFVLDGALDPSVSGLDVSVTQAIGFESALRAYMASCVQGKGCPFAGTVDDGMSALGAMLAKVDAAPLRNSDGRMLGADALVTAIVAALYAQSSWPYLTKALAAVADGDPGPAFQLADFYYDRSADGTYQDNSYEAFTAYNCVDYPDDATPAQTQAAVAEVKAKAPTIAPYWNVDLNTCDVWPAKPTGVREQIHADGAAPILVIGTTNDPATPYAWAQSLAHQLASGILITRVGQGHTGFNKGNPCVDSAVNDYFTKGTVPAGDVRCQ